MYSIFRNGIIAVFLVLTLYCCEKMPASPEDIYGLTSQKSQVSISFADSSDTLNVWGVAVLKPIYNLHGQKLIKTRFFIDGVPIFLYGNSTKGFRLDSRKLADGDHVFVLIVTSKIVNDAYPFGVTVVDSTEKVLLVDNRPGEPAKIDSVEIVNGVLRLRWTQNTKFSFQQYAVIKNGTQVTVIDESKKNYWDDEYYFGGKVKYQINVLQAGQETMGGKYNLNYPFPRILSIKKISNNKQAIQWHAYKFSSNFKSYELRVKRASRPLDPWLLLKNISSINDTVLVTDVFPFGDMISVRLEIKFKNTTFSATGQKILETAVGFPIPSFDRLKYIPAKKKIYLIGKYTTLLNSNTMKTIASTRNEIFISENGDWAFIITYFSRFASIDPETFEILNTYNMSDFIGYESLIDTFFPINDGMLIYLNTMAVNETEIIKLDMPNNMLNARVKADSLVYSLLSVNQKGDHVLTSSDGSKLVVYRIQDNSLTDPMTVKYKNFLFYKSNQFLFQNTKDIEFHNLTDLSLSHITHLDHV